MRLECCQNPFGHFVALDKVTGIENNSVSFIVEQSPNGTSSWSTLMNTTSTNGTCLPYRQAHTRTFTPTQGFVRVKYSASAAFSLANASLTSVDVDTVYTVLARGSYRYGFQGQEKDDEVKGAGNSVNYTFRMHDPRLGRFFAIDPLASQYPYYSPYQFGGNRPIDCVELEGLEPASAGKNIGERGVSLDSDGKWHQHKWDQVSTNLQGWIDEGTNINGYGGMSMNLPKNATDVVMKTIPASTVTLPGASYGSTTTVTIPEAHIVESFKINGKKYSPNFNEDGSFKGYWNSNGGKFSNKLNGNGNYKGNSYETRVIREITRQQLVKTLNWPYWIKYSKEAGSGAVQDIVVDQIIKKGGGGNNPQGPIDPWASNDNFTDKQIKQTLMQFGPGSVYYAFSLDMEYPDYEVMYWFKGYMSNGDPVFKIEPMKRRMMAEND